MDLAAVTRLLPSFEQLRDPGGTPVGRRTAAQSRMGADRRAAPRQRPQSVAADLGSGPRQARAPAWPSCSTPSPSRWMERMRRPMRPFGVWMRSTRCARAFGLRLITAARPACASLCSAPTSGSCRNSSIWREELGARQVSFLAVDVANPHAFGRTDDFVSDLALRPEDLPPFETILNSMQKRLQRGLSLGFHRRESAKIAAHPSILRCRPGTRRLPAGALQRAGIFRRDRCNRQRAALLFHIGAARCPGLRRRRRSRHGPDGIGTRPERRRHGGAARSDPHGLTQRMQDLRVFPVAGSGGMSADATALRTTGPLRAANGSKSCSTIRAPCSLPCRWRCLPSAPNLTPTSTRS